MSNIFDRIDVYDEESTPAAIVDYIASNQGCVNDKRHDNTTPLHLAISKKIPKIVDALLKHHANPNSQDGNGQTPLHLAISIDEPVIVKSLLGCQSADIDSPDNHGRTPLWLSARTGDIEIVEALVERNCSIAVRCRTCELTPLHIAVQNRHHDIARYLIEKKADLEAADAEGETPLFKAIRNCDFEMVHILKGASRTHQRKDGKTIQALSDDGAFERTVQETYGGLDEYVKKYPTSPRNSKVDRHENSKDEDEERKPAASTQKDKDHSTGVSNPPAVVSNSPTGSDPTPKNSTDAPPNPYLDSLVTHITRNGLQRLFGGGDERQLRNHLRANAEQAGALANAIGINHGSLAAFALLTIYDVAILIDDTRSMTSNGRVAINNLMGFLTALIRIYSHCGTGEQGKIQTIRFLNGNEIADHIDEAGITKLLKIHDYAGHRRTGNQLENKILKPLITKEMKRPLLVLVVVNGQAFGEVTGKLSAVLHDWISQLKSFPGGESSVFFQFCDAGGNGEAAKLVAELEKNQEIRPHIHCEPDNLGIAFDGSSFSKDMLDKIAKVTLSGLARE